jgi:hypothetical protein
VRVAGGVRQLVRAGGTGEIAPLLQQRSEIEGAVLVAAFLGPAIAGLGGTQIAAGLVQNPEIHCRARVRERVGLAIGELGADGIAPLLEQDPKSKLLHGGTGTVRRYLHAPRHLPAFPNHPCGNALTD